MIVIADYYGYIPAYDDPDDQDNTAWDSAEGVEWARTRLRFGDHVGALHHLGNAIPSISDITDVIAQALEARN